MSSLDHSESKIRECLDKNQFELCAISLQNLQAVTRQCTPHKQMKSIWQNNLKAPVNTGLSYYGTYKDIKSIEKSLGTLYKQSGVTTAQMKSKIVGSGHQAMVVIQGAGVKNIGKVLQRYSYAMGNELKSLNIALGSQFGVNHIEGFKLSIYFAIPFTMIDTLFQDEPTWSYFLGNLASSFLKAMTAATIGTIAVGAVTTLMLGEFVVFIACSIGISIVLDKIDKKFDLTDKLVKKLREIAQNSVDRDIARFNNSVNTGIGISQIKGKGLLW
ncbi:hypothetical protein [Vibrio quintilis]|uniref:Uncharacterized protein n=1 Tax=Vibrio quintilis TaxID=1117707 RepID=A0A1M7YPM4_9VIBR|nr:hypothetical protein [Vibrio quintilis]SHO54564.1 hypothetical protein VQ7734_00278 [Vibrio quintilis]